MGENETRFLSLSGQGFQLIRGTVMAEKKEFIRIRGARENNLKALNVDIPRNQFVVFTGLSGSGKSSLAFDTIYAEGQRRYMESLSSYARQFLGQMEKPNVDIRPSGRAVTMPLRRGKNKPPLEVVVANYTNI